MREVSQLMQQKLKDRSMNRGNQKKKAQKQTDYTYQFATDGDKDDDEGEIYDKEQVFQFEKMIAPWLYSSATSNFTKTQENLFGFHSNWTEWR